MLPARNQRKRLCFNAIAPRLWILALLFLSLSAARLAAQFDALADIPRHVAISKNASVAQPEIAFDIPETSAGKPYALRVEAIDDKTAPPDSLSLNGAPLSQRPVRGTDNNWYYLIAPSFLRAGENNLATPAGAIALEMISIEQTHEEAHFYSLFSASAPRTRRRQQPASDPNQLKFDALDYDLTLTLDMTKAYIPSASLTMTALSLDSSLQTVPLDFLKNNGDMVVSLVSSGDAAMPLLFDHTSDRLFITLAEAAPAGTTFSITVTYSGWPSTASLFGAAYAVGKHGTSNKPVVSTLSEPYGARTWWPCKDIPEDKATMSSHITCPTAYTAISNGSLTGPADNGDGTHTFHWRESYRMATYLYSIACTNYARSQAVYTGLDGQASMDVSHYSYPEANEPAAAVNGTVTILEVLAKIFGEYPFLTEKYVNATFHWGGGMEHQTCTSLYSGAAGADGLRWINVHETAHQYFGDHITMKHFDHLWLNEGFATYCEALWEEDRKGMASYHAAINSWGVSDTYPLVGPDADRFSGGIVYNKGAWVLHMLRRVVGDTVFFQALRNYVADPNLAYGVALSADLQAHFEALHGKDLTWFFDEWLYRASRPKYNWARLAVHEADGSWTLGLWIDQTQNDQPYAMPIDLDIRLTDNSSFDQTIFVDRDAQVFKIPTGAFDADRVTWDPENWVLDTASEVSFPARALWIGAQSLDYGEVGVGRPRTKSIAFENLGYLALHVTALDLSGAGAGAFSIVSPSEAGAFEVAGGVENGVEVLVRFSPTTEGGPFEAVLTVETSDAGTHRVDLRGTGRLGPSALGGTLILH